MALDSVSWTDQNGESQGQGQGQETFTNAFYQRVPLNVSSSHISRWHLSTNVFAETSQHIGPAKKGENGQSLREPLLAELLPGVQSPCLKRLRYQYTKRHYRTGHPPE
ncbi:hypothetical protein E4U39_002233 [Claviceps sp. Clav50 group G5]|nr:hypothetical protein E4U39_002233 [Claviceps sp. Clav50 group G5]